MGCASSALCCSSPNGPSSSKIEENSSDRDLHKLSENLLSQSIASDGISLLSRNQSARVSFTLFLKHEYKNQSQPLGSLLDRLNTAGGSDYMTVALHADAALATYSESHSPQRTHASLHKSYMDSDASMSTKGSSDSLHNLESPVKKRARRRSITQGIYHNQCQALIVLGAFPFFATSQSYHDWCEAQLSKKTSTASGDAGDVISLNRLVSFKFSSRDHDNASIDRLMESIFSTEANSMVNSKSWLHVFIKIVEDLPVCVTLAAASASQRGFPLIHVNKLFETTTGYARAEVIGKNCKFLQTGGYSESSQVDALAEALRTASPIKVKITNFKKDGTKFKNLLALKPIFDMEGSYCFVVGIQIDCGADDTDVEQLALVDDILFLIPSVMHHG